MGPGDGKPSIKASMSSANPSSVAKAHNWLWMSASGHSWEATENLEGDSSVESRTSAAAPSAASPQSRTGSNSLVAGVPLGAPGTISAMAFLALEQRVEARVT
jgi:gentisate 1,2-dioxygenase